MPSPPTTNHDEHMSASKPKHIHAVGGAKLVSSLMNAGVVDEVRLTVHPIVLGSGKPLFKDVESRRLTLCPPDAQVHGCTEVRFAR